MAPLGPVKELQMQNAELEFEISLKAVSVLRYITDHIERYGPGASEGAVVECGTCTTGAPPMTCRRGIHKKSANTLSRVLLVLLSVFSASV